MIIKETVFEGFKNCFELTAGGLKMVVMAGFGPRVLYFGSERTGNILYVEKDPMRKTKGFRHYGGHRFWLGPETKHTSKADNRPCTVEEKDGTLKVTALDAEFHLEKSLLIKEKNGRFRVEHILLNKGKLLYVASLWGLTCVPPVKNSVIFFPWSTLGNWKMNKIIYWQRWSRQKTNVNSRQYVQTPDLFLVRPTGKVGKIGSAGYEGFVGVTQNNYTFIKKFDYVPSAQYPDDNCAVEVYTSRWFYELETLSPLYTVIPGRPVSHTEEWVLAEKAVNPENGDEVRSLL